MKRLSHLPLISLLFLSPAAWGAACCGGGFAAPAILAGDDRAQVTTSYSMTEVVVDNVDAGGFWRKWDDHQRVQTFRLEGAHLISDRWQAGMAVPIVQRSFLDQSYAGLGDVTGTLGYEYLPDWNYNPFRPKGIGYLQLTLPTGKARAESDVGGLDSRGNGFWALGAGTLLTKVVGKWDVFSSLEVHRSFAKSVATSQINGTLKPGFGGNFGIGGGFNTAFWRLGGSLTWTYEDAVRLEGSSNADGAVERYATAALAASYLATDEWAGTISYSDQTLFGAPTNTSLGRSVALQLQRRWGR